MTHPSDARRLVAAVPVVLCLWILAAVLSLGPPDEAGADGPIVTGGGSSYAALAINNWVGQVSTLFGLQVNYQTSSSVIGLNEFCQGQIDVGASEIGYSTNQAQCNPQAPRAPYQYMPDVAGATCLMFNLNSATSQPVSQLALTPSVLLGIFTGQITNWNDPAIQGVPPNRSIPLPSAPIHVVYRSDASGENYIFSDYFNTLFGSQWASFTSAMHAPAGAQAVWPTPPGGTSAGGYSEANWVGQNGSDLASNYVASQPDTITYVETGYAIEHNKPCAYVQNAAGQFVQPSETGDATALQHAQLLPDLEQLLTGVFNAPEANAYPISAYSYFISQEGQMDPGKAAVFSKFLLFVSCQGQQAAASLGYAPLPPVLIQDDWAAINRLPNHVALPGVINAQTCPNPYLQGTITAGAGGPIGGAQGTSGAPPVEGPGAAGGAGGAGGGSGSGPGGAAGAAGGASGPGAAGGPGSGTATAAGAAGARGAHGGASGGGTANGQSAILNPHARASSKVAGGATAPPGQVPGLALESAVNRFFHLRGPLGAVIAWTTLFLLVLVGPPVAAVLYRRRRRAGPPGAAPEGPEP